MSGEGGAGGGGRGLRDGPRGTHDNKKTTMCWRMPFLFLPFFDRCSLSTHHEHFVTVWFTPILASFACDVAVGGGAG